MDRPDASSRQSPDVSDLEKVLELGLGFWASKAVLSAVELGLFTLLAEGPADADTLALRLGLHSRSARDFLDALTALGMLDRTNGRYANTAASDYYLDRRKPSYIGGLLEMANARLYAFWGALTEGLRSGRPQNEAKGGGENFDRLYGDPRKLREFLGAMTGLSLDAASAIAERFAWSDFRTFADIGCAQGGTATAVAMRHRHIEGIGFDLPPVRPVFEDYVRAAGVSARLRFQAGDFFAGDLPRADVLILGHILQHWNLEQKILLIEKCHRALPSGGALIVYDWILDDDRRSNALGLLMSLNMLIETSGGFDYTGADCRGWMQSRGFRGIEVEHLHGPDSIVVGYK